jgi:hypothetical protein
MKNGILILAGALLLAPATPLAAQTITSHPASERGQHSLALSFYGGQQIGYWTKKSDRTDLGLDFGVSGAFRDETTDLTINLTPALKHYLSAAGALAPYSYVGLPFSWNRTSRDNVGAPDGSSSAVSVGGSVGLGLDWFPLPQVSIGGHAGLVAYHWGSEGAEGTFIINTLSSGVRVQLYF